MIDDYIKSDMELAKKHSPKKFKKTKIYLPVSTDDVDYIEIKFRQGSSLEIARDQAVAMLKQYYKPDK